MLCFLACSLRRVSFPLPALREDYGIVDVAGLDTKHTGRKESKRIGVEARNRRREKVSGKELEEEGRKIDKK